MTLHRYYWSRRHATRSQHVHSSWHACIRMAVQAASGRTRVTILQAESYCSNPTLVMNRRASMRQDPAASRTGIQRIQARRHCITARGVA